MVVVGRKLGWQGWGEGGCMAESFLTYKFKNSDYRL